MAKKKKETVQCRACERYFYEDQVITVQYQDIRHRFCVNCWQKYFSPVMSVINTLLDVVNGVRGK
jgi:hypothetical protein